MRSVQTESRITLLSGRLPLGICVECQSGLKVVQSFRGLREERSNSRKKLHGEVASQKGKG